MFILRFCLKTSPETSLADLSSMLFHEVSHHYLAESIVFKQIKFATSGDFFIFFIKFSMDKIQKQLREFENRPGLVSLVTVNNELAPLVYALAFAV